jgi:hypothetical protein
LRLHPNVRLFCRPTTSSVSDSTQSLLPSWALSLGTLHHAAVRGPVLDIIKTQVEAKAITPAVAGFLRLHIQGPFTALSFYENVQRYMAQGVDDAAVRSATKLVLEGVISGCNRVGAAAVLASGASDALQL